MRSAIAAGDGQAVRSEHQTTDDEFDAFTGWHHVVVRMQRASVRKATKRRSRRADRHAARRRIADSANQEE